MGFVGLKEHPTTGERYIVRYSREKRNVIEDILGKEIATGHNKQPPKLESGHALFERKLDGIWHIADTNSMKNMPVAEKQKLLDYFNSHESNVVRANDKPLQHPLHLGRSENEF